MVEQRQDSRMALGQRPAGVEGPGTAGDGAKALQSLRSTGDSDETTLLCLTRIHCCRLFLKNYHFRTTSPRGGGEPVYC